MKTEQRIFTTAGGWRKISSDHFERNSCDLLIAFGDTEAIQNNNLYHFLRTEYPFAAILICSTAGEIMDVEVFDNSVSVLAIQFKKTNINTAIAQISDFESSFHAGYELACRLPHDNLKAVFLFSDGQQVNGSELILALNEFLPPGTLVTGGMAGDGGRFQKTLVGLNEVPAEGRIAVIGFYGDHIRLSSGSVGGWDAFGVERLITRSDKNILFELDGKPALDVYKLYLGEYAADLPGAALLFPLSIREADSKLQLVRTILGVDEHEKSLIFAGNTPQGSYAQLMKANHDRLIDGAGEAAEQSMRYQSKAPEIAILISCVGRKLVLGQRIEEEVEIIRSVFGESTALTGFYSYGEFAPATGSSRCDLHNQTMTITTISEE